MTSSRRTSQRAGVSARRVAVLWSAVVAAIVAVGLVVIVALTGDEADDGGEPDSAREATGGARAEETGGARGEDTGSADVPVDVERLRWPPPELEDPETVVVETDGGGYELDDGTDYVIQMPDEPVTGAVSLSGGRNIHLIGGAIAMSEFDRAALTLQHWRGVLHVEGLQIDPGGAEGHENDAFRVNSEHAGSTAQLQNIWVDLVAGTKETNHADIMQSWGGPAKLRIDRFTGSTTYQGFFLALEQFEWAPDSVEISISDVDLHGVAPGPASLYDVSNHSEGPHEATVVAPTVMNVWSHVDGERGADFPRYHVGGSVPSGPRGVQQGWANGSTEESHFVDPDRVGIGYRSPGYRAPS